MRPFGYTPVFLVDAVAEIKQEHGSARGRRVGPGIEPIGELLMRIRCTDETEITRLFGRLQYSQLADLCDRLVTIVDDDRLFTKVAIGLLSRRCDTVAHGLCRLVGEHYDQPEVMRIVGEIIVLYEWQECLPVLPPLEEGLDVGNADGMRNSLAGQYEASGVSWLEWSEQLSGLGVRKELEASFASKLGADVASTAAREYPAVFFGREDAETVRTYAQSLVSQQAIKELAQGYLPSTPVDSWDEEILQLLVELLQDPRLRQELWEGVAPELQLAVVRWINRNKLSEFFIRGAGDRKRFEFWLQFVDHMGPYSEGRIDRGQGFFEFPGFGVVEFMETGNAAYFYDKSLFMTLLRKRPYPANYGLKWIDSVLTIQGEEGRLFHRGDWDQRWRPRVAALIAQEIRVEQEEQRDE